VSDTAPPVLVRVVRDGVVESVHRGHVVVVDAEGRVRGAVGRPGLSVYGRSALKPFQALAVLDLLGMAGVAGQLDDVGLAIACGSHEGTDTHQIEAARLLALADLDESVLRCPAALPLDPETARVHGPATALAHNCSGKHAAFLWAQTALRADPASYLDPAARLQRRVAERLADVTGATPEGPGVDGCGAPAWRLPLQGLATGFARLAAAAHGDGAPLGLGRVRRAMSTYPHLVGGAGADDSAFMRADPGVVAKRGAEAVFAAGITDVPGGPFGIALKISDGGQRAAGPTAAVVLAALGAVVPARLLRPVILGGGRPCGHLEVDEAVAGIRRNVGAGG
jgi:L-asparaginase II